MQRLPFFVYGTLRVGQGNYQHILAGNTVREVRNVRLQDHIMYSSGVGFVFDDSTSQFSVLGDVIWVDEAVYLQVSARLDRLEGVYDAKTGKGHSYCRVQREVYLPEELAEEPGEPVTIWVYQGSENVRVNFQDRGTRDLVADGDWVRYAGR